MATYTTLRKGSTGDEVKKLQTSLGITADGIYGNQTEKAVKEYQTKNGLSVDGIAGDQTLGKLYGDSTATTAPTTTPTAQSKAASKYGEFKYDPYEESDLVKQANALLEQQIANKPGEYNSNWQAHLNETLNKILNREDFSYDLNGDALYQQYKDQYTTQGQMAMMDAMGQAAAMTGGYGNSYAQSVGQQTYQGYLQQLNDKFPELYQLALDQYNREGQDLYNQYGLYADRENMDYGRYRDAASDYNNELARLTEEARYQAETDYGKYMDKYNMDYGQFIDDRNYDYQKDRDAVADYQWRKEFDEIVKESEREYYRQIARDNVADAQWQKEFDEATRQYNEQMAYQKEQDALEDAWREREFQKKNETVDDGGTDDTPVSTKTSSYNFTGTTYSEAVSEMKANGVPDGIAAGVMTQTEWSKRKSSYQSYGTGGAEAKYYSTYKEYLAYFVPYAIENFGN